MPQILFFARSYLTSLAPQLDSHLRSNNLIPYYLTQTIGEQKKLTSANLRTILPSFQSVIATALRGRNLGFELYDLTGSSIEIQDIKEKTDFPNDPVLADRFLKHLDQDQAYRIASIIFSYTKYLFCNHEFEAVIGEPVTMFPTHCLMYWAIKLNVKPLFWCSGFTPNTMYFTSKLDLNPIPLSHSNRPQPSSMEDVNEALQYIGLIKSKSIGPIYNKDYYKRDKQDNPFLYLLRSRSGARPLIYERSFYYVFYAFLRAARSWLSLVSFRISYNYTQAFSLHENLQALQMAIKSFNASAYSTKQLPTALSSYPPGSPLLLFYPLQYEPEASLDYLAPAIGSQESFLRRVIHSIDERAILIIKEHPNQLGALLMAKWGFLRDSPQVLCLPGTLNARDIMLRVGGVISISSSASFEAAVMGIPTFLFSDCYFSRLPSVLRLDNPALLSKQVIEKHINIVKKFRYIDHMTANELYRISLSIAPGDPQPSDSLYTKENLQNLSKLTSSMIQFSLA
jgi:hypothetical protein